MKQYSILSIASQVSPFSKTGGLADVARSLPKSLARLGHEVSIVTPLYSKIIDAKKHGLKKIFSDVTLTFANEKTRTISVYQGELMPKLPIYFIAFDKYFGRKQAIYGSDNENKRFYLLCEAALVLPTLLKKSFDILHCHDWHAGLIPELLKKQHKDDEYLRGTATVFTIHNLIFQFGHNWWEVAGEKRDRGITPLPDFDDHRKTERVNFTKRAILHADAINTVSETYAEEIMQKRFGQDLHRIIKNRSSKLFGIVNGIDYNEFNPLDDKTLAMQFDYRNIKRKLINKRALQKKMKLAEDDATCLVVMTSRIAEQKGFDILLPIIPTLLKLPTQFIFLGDGDKEYLKKLNKLVRENPKRIVMHSFDEFKHLETLFYAGGDISLFPSRLEPCGINQLKSMRYGCVPVAREIGGLSDTIIDVDVAEKSGNGFLFKEYTDYALLAAISRAVAHFQHHRSWRPLAVRGMKQSNSWELPARKYVELYKKTIQFKNETDNLG